MSHAEQLERETEQTRTQIANTLDELRTCVTPGHVLDQLADRVSDGAAAAFAQNLKHQTVNNPLPVVVIGCGLAWLMLVPVGIQRAASCAARQTVCAMLQMRQLILCGVRPMRPAGLHPTRPLNGVTGLPGLARTQARASARPPNALGRPAPRPAVACGTSRARWPSPRRRPPRGPQIPYGVTAGSMADTVQRSASEGYDAIADGARRTASGLSGSTKAAGQRTLQTGSAFVDLCREQPLIVTGLGIAVGAMIGALLSATETEDRLMGETSDRVKDRVQDLASEQYENAKEVGERALETAQDEAAKQATKQEEGGSEGAAKHAKAHEATLSPTLQTASGEDNPGRPKMRLSDDRRADERPPLWVVLVTAALFTAGFRPRRLSTASTSTDDLRRRPVSEEGRGRLASMPSEISARGWKDILIRVYRNISEHRVVALAAGVTFYSLLAIFPAIAALVAVYGLFTDAATLAVHLEKLSGLLPGGALDVLRDQLTRVASQRGSTLGLTFLVGLAVSLWSANAAMKSIFDTLNIVYAEREERSFIKLNAISLAFTAAGILFVLLAIGALVVVPPALKYLGLSELSEFPVWAGRWPVLFAVVTFALAFIYRHGPSREKPRWQWISWGSAFAAFAWLAVSMP